MGLKADLRRPLGALKRPWYGPGGPREHDAGDIFREGPGDPLHEFCSSKAPPRGPPGPPAARLEMPVCAGPQRGPPVAAPSSTGAAARGLSLDALQNPPRRDPRSTFKQPNKQIKIRQIAYPRVSKMGLLQGCLCATQTFYPTL